MTNGKPDSDSTSIDLGQQLTTAMNQTGLPSTIRGKVQRWVVRFIAGTIAHPTFQEMRENLDTVDGRSRINALVAEELGRRAISDPEYMERAKARFMGDWGRKHDNVEAVAAKALALSDNQPDADIGEQAANKEPDQDWLNAFTRAAEDASSEELRDRLAAILAGEARKPGSISRSTVRLVAELDKEVLEDFRSLLPLRVHDHFPKSPEWDKQFFQAAIGLEDAGLVSGNSAMLSKSMSIDDQGYALIGAQAHGLAIKGPVGAKINYPACLLTKAGREIANLLGDYDDRDALRALANFIEKGQFTEVVLGPIIARQANSITIRPTEQLWTSPAVTQPTVPTAPPAG